MRHIRLEAYDDDFGNLGLIVCGTPKNDEIMADIQGGMIAHDLLEHQNGVAKIGCPGDELEALGAIWQVRGRHGDFVSEFRNIYSPEQNLAFSIAQVARDMHGACGWWPTMGRYRTHRHFQDESFMEMVELARPTIVSEIGEGYIEDFPMEAFLDNALHLLRTGYRKAERRFGSGYRGIDTFRAVKEAVKPICTRCQNRWGDPEVEVGTKFRLSYGDGRAICEEIYA